MSDKHESLIRAQAYLDAKQSLTTRTGKNTRGKLKCTAGNKQCGGRCIPQAWDCRLEGKGTNSELKAHQQDIVGGASSIQRGVKTIIKNPADPKSVQRGRDGIIRGIVKVTPGDNLEEKKKLKRRLQKDFNKISTAIVTGALVTVGHTWMMKNNARYRRGIGGQVDRAAWQGIDAVMDRVPIIGRERAMQRAAAEGSIASLGRAIGTENARDRVLAARGLTSSRVRMSPIGLPPGGTDFTGSRVVPALQDLQRRARKGEISYDQWSREASKVIYGAKAGGHSVYSGDAANRLLARQFGLDLAEGTLQRSGSNRIRSAAVARGDVIGGVAERLGVMSGDMKRDMELRRFPTNKDGSYSNDTIRNYVDTVAIPRMGLLNQGMSAGQQNTVRRQIQETVGAVIKAKNPTDFNRLATGMHNKQVSAYDKYFSDVAEAMGNTNAMSRDFLFGDGVVGVARYSTFQQGIPGEQAPRILSRDHARLVLRDYYERRVMGDKSRTFSASAGTVQRVAQQINRGSTPNAADAFSIVRESGIRGLRSPNEAPKAPKATRARKPAATKQPSRGLAAQQRQSELAKSIMKRKGWTGSLAEAYALARKEIRGDDEHMSPTITKRNPPEPLVTNSTPTVVNGPTSSEHLPKDEDEMVTPLMPVSKMSESPSPKEAEEIAQEAQEEEPKPSGKPIKLSLSIEIPAEALAAKRSDAYEAEKQRLREDSPSGKSKGKACGESHIPSKHECTIGTGGAALKGSGKESKIAGIREKGKTEAVQHTNEKGERTAAYRARQLGSALARAGFTVGTGVLAAKVGKKDPLAAGGLAMMSLLGAKSLKRELTVTRSNKDLVKDFSSLKGLDGVEDATIDQMVGFVQEAGIDVQRVKTAALAGGVKGYFDTAQPSRVHTSAGESELNMSRTGQQKKLYKGKTDAETMTGGVQSMIAQREAYYNSDQRKKLLAGQAQSVEDLYELHSTGQFVGTSKARALYTNAHEIAHAIHYRGDFATPKSVTVNGKVYSGTELEIELIKSSSYYGQSDIRRKPRGKVDNYYDTGSRLETYAENYAMYVGGGESMKKAFPVSYEWTKQTTDYALSKPVKKPARTFSSVVEELVEQGERQYIKDRMDAPKEQQPQKTGDELFVELYPKVQAAASKGDVKAFAELLGQAMQGELEEDQMLILNDYIETVRMYEVVDGRARPENQGEQGFAEQGDEEEEPAQEEEKTDARRDAYMATRFAWT